MSQVPEESYTQAQFRQTFKNNRQFVNLLVLGSDSSGTHVSWEDSRGERHFGVISDLTAVIVRRGSGEVTIGANATSGTLSITLSPALIGAVADYLVYATLEDEGLGISSTWSIGCHAKVVTLSSLRIRLTRNRFLIPANLTSTSSDSPADPHSHTWPVSQQQLSNTGDGAIIHTVFWVILKA